MRILVLDNYDSFTFNLFHYLNNFEDDVTVKRNDEISVEAAGEYDRIVFSPGPGLPSEAGVMNAIIRKYFNEKKMLGICLGMQAMVEVSGGSLFNLNRVHHGVALPIRVTDLSEKLFDQLPSEFLTGRYHSWAVNPQLPEGLKPTAIDDEGVIMALSHENQLVKGVQFHPESILTEYGMQLISNWLYKC
jgi:anthranilate synthase component 2